MVAITHRHRHTFVGRFDFLLKYTSRPLHLHAFLIRVVVLTTEAFLLFICRNAEFRQKFTTWIQELKSNLRSFC
jgi:hypothetical protein